MSEASRNFRVGLFVLAGVIGIGSCAVILGGQGLFAKRVRFESYFDEPVTGLDVGSPVLYRGVKIGVVKSIGMVEDYYDFALEEDRLEYGRRVSILMERVFLREEEAPERDLDYAERRKQLEQQIERGLRVRLSQSGITGVTFIQADYLDAERHPPMKLAWTPRHLYIPSAPSTIASLTSAVERFAGSMEKIDLAELAGNVDTLILELTRTVQQADIDEVGLEAVALLSELRETNAQLQASLEEADVGAIGQNANAALTEATATLVRTRRMMDAGRYDLEIALENTRVATENLRDLTETLKAQPSLVLRGEPPKEVHVEVGP